MLGRVIGMIVMVALMGLMTYGIIQDNNHHAKICALERVVANQNEIDRKRREALEEQALRVYIQDRQHTR